MDKENLLNRCLDKFYSQSTFKTIYLTLFQRQAFSSILNDSNNFALIRIVNMILYNTKCLTLL